MKNGMKEDLKMMKDKKMEVKMGKHTSGKLAKPKC